MFKYQAGQEVMCLRGSALLVMFVHYIQFFWTDVFANSSGDILIGCYSDQFNMIKLQG